MHQSNDTTRAESVSRGNPVASRRGLILGSTVVATGALALGLAG